MDWLTSRRDPSLEAVGVPHSFSLFGRMPNFGTRQMEFGGKKKVEVASLDEVRERMVQVDREATAQANVEVDRVCGRHLR